MCLLGVSEDHLPVYFHTNHRLVLVTDRWESSDKPAAVQVDQLPSDSVDLPAASAANSASLATAVEVIQLSGNSHQESLGPVPSAGLDTIPNNSLIARPEALPDLPLMVLASETEPMVVEPLAEQACGGGPLPQDR